MASLAKAVQRSKKANTQTTMFAVAKSPFLETLTEQDLVKIRTATEVVLDFETTCLSPFDMTPTPLTSSSKIGDKTAGQYIKATGAAFNNASRARILSLGLPETGDFLIFDLDRLSEEEKQALLTASIHNKVLVGHNLQFDLMWANAICPGVKPARIVDTMLLLRSHLPQAETLLRKRLARDFYTAPRDREALTELITNADASSAKKDSGFGSLLAACLVVCLPAPDKSYQKPQNWMPDILSQKHYEYCQSDVFEPVIIARRLLTLAAVAHGSETHTTKAALRGQYDQIPTDGLLSLLDRLPGADAYRSSESAIPVLLELQKNGLRMDGEATEQYANQQIEKAAQIFEDELAQYPAMQNLKSVILEDGETQQLKAAINAAVGGVLPRTEKDELSLSKKALTLCGLDQHPVISAYLKIKALRKRADMVRDYFSLVDAEQRLHPMVAINTKTLRTSSQNPNLQNVPRDGAVRSLYCAAPGNAMVAVDYSAIELRIAAALTVRAVREIRAMLDDKDGWGPMHWLRDAVTDLLSKADAVELAQDPRAYEDIDSVESGVSIDRWKAHYAGQFATRIQQVQQAGGLTLLKAFQHNVDPHLATALYLLSIRGEYDLQGKNPVDYLAGISAEEQSALKKQYKGDRQAAKACNFGLLYKMGPESLHKYGITGYGLDWTEEDAEAAYHAWHNLYPEIGLWQLYTQLHGLYVDPSGAKRHDLAVGHHTERRVELADNRKVYQSSTLSGRPIVSRNLTEAMNFQDQGSGAEIALEALACLPGYLRPHVVLFVHDEIVLEVPKDKATAYQRDLERIMVAAAEALLTPFGVPVEVEGAISEHWQH